MPLFKVWNRDRTKKCFAAVEGSNALINLLAAASKKLDINGSSLVLEQDGTVIDEDEILLELYKETLILLQANEFWISSTANKDCDQLSVISSGKASTVSVLSVENDILQPVDLNLLNTSSEAEIPSIMLIDSNMELMWSTYQIPWHKLPVNVIESCEQGMRNKEIVSQVIRMIVAEMRSIKKNPSAKSVRLVAQKIVSKYPKTFQDVDDDGVILGDGSITVYMKLYERISYLNRPHKRVSNGESTMVTKKKLKNSVAGCSNWEPSALNEKPENDTDEIKSKLLDFQNAQQLHEEMKMYLEKTFNIQREFINNTEKTPSVNDIKREWPVLFNKYGLIWHFENVCKSADVRNFIQNFEQKYDKLLKIANDDEFEIPDPGLKVLHVLCKYFKEKIEKIYLSFNGASEDEILPLIGLEPCIVEMAGKFHIFLEKQKIIISDNFAESFHILFGLYFVLNLAYSRDISCTLETIQRYILKIHPEEGTKSKKKNLSKRKVINLLNKLRNF